MNLNQIMPELMTERIKGALPLKVGELLAARVLQVEGELFYLLLGDGTVLKSRLMADLKLRQGEEMVLKVKDIEGQKVELSVVYRQKEAADAAGSTAVEYRNRADREYDGIVCRLLEEGLPVTPENIKEAQRAVKLLAFIMENKTLMEKSPPLYQGEDLARKAIDQIVKWLIESGQKEPAGEEGCRHQKLLLLMEEMADTEVRDIIKLMRFGLKITPGNLVLAKNLRENKGFPGILLKTICEKAMGKDEPRQHAGEGTVEEALATLSDFVKAKREDRKGAEVQKQLGPKAEPLDLKSLLKSIVENDKAVPRQRAAAELLLERACFLEEALSGRNLCVLPFLFDGRIFECWVKVSRRDGGTKQGDDVLELVVEAEPPNLGSIRVLIRLQGTGIEISFYALKEQTKNLIDGQREALRQSIENSGFRVKHIACRRMADKQPETADRFLDLRV